MLGEAAVGAARTDTFLGERYRRIARRAKNRAIVAIDQSLTIVTALPDNLDPVMADVTQLEHALVNLCVNARDAMPTGGTLRIGTQNIEIDERWTRKHQGCVPGRYAAISVSDTGIGMTQEIQTRIGQYEIQGWVTRTPAGGLAQARDLGLGRLVALKHVADPASDAGARLRTEARLNGNPISTSRPRR